MTLASLDIPLPSDFYTRSAYMRLYRAYCEGDAYWPCDVFGDEITHLLSLEHAEVYGAGYRLTSSGIAYWEESIRLWDVCSKGANTRTAAALYALQDGDWHDVEAIPYEAQMSANTWKRFVRPNLVNSLCIDYDGRRVRLTDKGRAALGRIEEKAS